MDYLVELDFSGPGFVAVPNEVADLDALGADALGVLVYLARLAGNRGPRIVRVSAILRRFRFGKDKWQRIARELRAVGAMRDVFGRSDDGRSIARAFAVGWPGAATCKPENPARTSRPVCEPEKPALTAANPAEVGRESPALKKDQNAARGGGTRAAKPPRAASGSVLKGEGRSAQPRRSPHGCGGASASPSARRSDARPVAGEAQSSRAKRSEALDAGAAKPGAVASVLRTALSLDPDKRAARLAVMREFGFAPPLAGDGDAAMSGGL